MPVDSSALLAPPERLLPLLFEVSRGLGRQAELSDALPPLLDSLASSCGLERCALALSSAEGETPVYFAVTEAPDKRLLGSSLAFGEGPLGAALATGLPQERGGYVAVPILSGGLAVGALGGALRDGAHGAARSAAQGVGRVPIGSPAELRLLFESVAALVSEALGLRRRFSAAATRSPAQAAPLRDEAACESGLIGKSQAMEELRALIQKVAPSEATVLILGESGTGKELAARAIHELSPRSGGPFVAVNCAALPAALIESELFGHEKGSFTGASARRLGRFELAAGGSIFLDEVSELAPELQAKLLRVLQERSFERVGGGRPLRADVRVVAATNRDLEREVVAGRFRSDLYWRLAVFPLRMPPLRERGGDIVILADRFAERFGASQGKRIARISTPAIDLLMSYHWPGNVRELENAIERAVILSSDGVIHAYHLPPSLQSAESTGTGPASTLDASLARLERELLVEALKMEDGKAAAAARRLGVTERRMGLALKRYGIDWRRFRGKSSP
jgi:Nif-specific regulatory protein